MNKTKLSILAAVSMVAHANAITLEPGFALGDFLIDFDNPNPAGVTVSYAGGNLQNTDLQSEYVRPVGSTGFYAVTNVNSPGITMTFDGPQNVFGLLWGSADTYNTLEFYYNSQPLGTYTGAIISPSDGTTSKYMNFTNFTYDEVRFSSTTQNFEIDNVTFGQVPEPGAAMLMGMAGFALLIRRR